MRAQAPRHSPQRIRTNTVTGTSAAGAGVTWRSPLRRVLCYSPHWRIAPRRGTRRTLRRRTFITLLGSAALSPPLPLFALQSPDQREDRKMIEKKVPYQVNGRSFEGVIVYDDSVTAKRTAIF